MKQLKRSILLSEYHMTQLFHCVKYTMPWHKALYEDTIEGVWSRMIFQVVKIFQEMQFCSCWILRYPRNMDIFKYYLLPRILAHAALTSSKFGIFELGVAEDEILEPAPRAGHTALPSQTRRTCCWGEGGEEGHLIWSWGKSGQNLLKNGHFLRKKQPCCLDGLHLGLLWRKRTKGWLQKGRRSCPSSPRPSMESST